MSKKHYNYTFIIDVFYDCYKELSLIKNKDIVKIIDTFNSLSFLLGLFVYLKTQSFTYAFVATIGAIIFIQIIRFTVIGIKNSKLKKSGISEVDKMDGFQFEAYLELLFSAIGYRVKRTKSRSDFGADLILIKDRTKTVVQAKRYSSNVRIKAVQEIIGAVKYYDVDASMVVTNSYYTKAAIELANKNNVMLINRDQLVNKMLDINLEKRVIDPIAVDVVEEENSDTLETIIPDCPSCDIQMVVRKSRKGNQFLGCSNFPKCRKTYSLPKS